MPALDVTRKVARVDARRARAPGGWARPATTRRVWRRILDDVNVALCAELVGTSERALELAVEYAKVRVQFDRPIATFQAIKHKAADMLHHLELARVGTHYAAWASDADDPERERPAAMCKGYVAEAADAVTAECIQVHGGVGLHLGRRLPPAVPPGQAGRPALRGPGLPAPAPGRPRAGSDGLGA